MRSGPRLLRLAGICGRSRQRDQKQESNYNRPEHNRFSPADALCNDYTAISRTAFYRKLLNLLTAT
jgi:hypothetical protein